MKKSYVEGVSQERVAAMAKSPMVVQSLALMRKVTNGTATREEKQEFRKNTARARSLNPRILVD